MSKTRENIIRLANDFILKYKIDALPLHIDDFQKLCDTLGYDLLSFSGAAALAKAMNLEKCFERPAFLICRSNCHAVCFDEKQSVGTRLFALAHEIGHIALKHEIPASGTLCCSDTDTVTEAEANTFAYALTAPLAVLHDRKVRSVEQIQHETLLDEKQAAQVCLMLASYRPAAHDAVIVRQYKKRQAFFTRREKIILPVACAVAIVSLAVAQLTVQPKPSGKPADRPAESTHDTSFLAHLRDSITTTASTSQSTAEASEPTVATTSAALSELTTELATEPEQTETVYITRYGERYHKQNCSQIKNSIAFPTSLSEAVAEGYTPCKTCYK
mgnify:FL=1